MGGEMMPLINRLKSLVVYDRDTGLFTWLVAGHGYGGKFHVGDVAGTMKDGYTVLNIDGRQYRAHRLAWLFERGEFPPKGFEIDHANGVRSDNRWMNLRLATRSQNNTNAPRTRRNNSGQRGVSWRSDRNKWHARIHVNKKPRILGDFDSLDDAIAARKQAEAMHYGEFTRT